MRKGEVGLLVTVIVAIFSAVAGFYAEDEYKFTVSINDAIGVEIDSNSTKPALIYIKGE